MSGYNETRVREIQGVLQKMVDDCPLPPSNPDRAVFLTGEGYTPTKELRALGEELGRMGGRELMIRVAYGLQCHPSDLSELNFAWDDIHGWLA